MSNKHNFLSVEEHFKEWASTLPAPIQQNMKESVINGNSYTYKGFVEAYTRGAIDGKKSTEMIRGIADQLDDIDNASSPILVGNFGDSMQEQLDEDIKKIPIPDYSSKDSYEIIYPHGSFNRI